MEIISKKRWAYKRKKFTCPKCAKVIWNLNAHLRLVHGEDASYQEMPEVVVARSQSEKERVGVFISYQTHIIYY